MYFGFSIYVINLGQALLIALLVKIMCYAMEWSDEIHDDEAQVCSGRWTFDWRLRWLMERRCEQHLDVSVAVAVLIAWTRGSKSCISVFSHMLALADIHTPIPHTSPYCCPI